MFIKNIEKRRNTAGLLSGLVEWGGCPGTCNDLNLLGKSESRIK